MINYDIYVDPSWTYRQTVTHLRALRLHYEDVLRSFSSWEYKERGNFIRATRNKFYALNCIEWQKDRIWNYMNGNDNLNSIIISSLRYK